MIARRQVLVGFLAAGAATAFPAAGALTAAPAAVPLPWEPPLDWGELPAMIRFMRAETMVSLYPEDDRAAKPLGSPLDSIRSGRHDAPAEGAARTAERISP